MTAQEAMDMMKDRGHLVMTWDDIYFHDGLCVDAPGDLWADVLLHWQRGWGEAGKFYVYVACTGGRLGLLSNATAGKAETAESAIGLSALAVLRYDQVWVVSDAGAWSAHGPE